MWRLHYVNTKKKGKELGSTTTYTLTSKDEKSITDNHSIQSVRFAVNIREPEQAFYVALVYEAP